MVSCPVHVNPCIALAFFISLAVAHGHSSLFFPFHFSNVLTYSRFPFLITRLPASRSHHHENHKPTRTFPFRLLDAEGCHLHKLRCIFSSALNNILISIRAEDTSISCLAMLHGTLNTHSLQQCLDC